MKRHKIFQSLKMYHNAVEDKQNVCRSASKKPGSTLYVPAKHGMQAAAPDNHSMSGLSQY
jgi:hypothetical protein